MSRGLVSIYSDLFKRVANCSDSEATNYTAIANVFYTIGRLMWGMIADKIGNRNSFYCFALGQCLLFACFPLMINYNYYLFYTLFCLCLTLYGGAKVLLAPIINEYMYKENANTTVGMSLLSVSAAAIAGPFGTIALRDYYTRNNINNSTNRTDYDLFFYVSAGITGLSVLSIYFLRPLQYKN